uniref:Sidoreflexin n=1 Tax=Strombidium inclinatum TaxID=197538 RepID=A0A7S3IEW7_9SPIT|mmetsp:Transcript_13231/g.20651  ORF Transcript_13231/g.20651 Transcript_13231/m.20651 type:complete len:357 (+) Transcript_13231:44-1114(+)|eukprot:CAMPEP_0170481334 /NCGR_PEP_ID=MMETSP0208-20121228/1817_1 /TAXON_ID=197538 /ORGANISM="Strombidium inclinatum, Strain S3" /LENGTH=356 /DNA_ID=CAMNT_0010754021 /DNA_START=23 /DNA_END=1093 /DNA_ORIENTATION=-
MQTENTHLPFLDTPIAFPEDQERSPFDVNAAQFDSSTYLGRFKMSASQLNPLLYLTPRQTVVDSQKLVADYKIKQEATGEPLMLSTTEIEAYKKATRVVASAVHPDTGEIVPRPMRFNGFAYFNVPLISTMLFMKNQTPLFNAALQWLNQTYNCGVNYGNRNASSNYTMTDVGRGYFGAVLASITIAMGTRRIFASQLSKAKGSKLILMNALLNLVAASIPGATNLTIMRAKELSEGIEVQNEDGTVTYGKSVAAGRKAIKETAMSRFILPVPVLVGPAVGALALEKLGWWPKRARAAKMMELSLVTFSLLIAVPMSVALFEQRSKIDREQIEPCFKELRDASGAPVNTFYFNKGL